MREQVHHDGLWGFSGGHPEEFISIDGQWGDVAPGTSAEARTHILNAGQHTHNFVIAHWPPQIWEVAWFVNPHVSFLFYFFSGGSVQRRMSENSICQGPYTCSCVCQAQSYQSISILEH